MIKELQKLILTKSIEYYQKQLKKIEFPPIPSIENKYMYNDKNKIYVVDIEKNIDLTSIYNRFITTENKDNAKDWSEVFGHKLILWACNLNLPKEEKYRWRIFKSANVILDAKISTIIGGQSPDTMITENLDSRDVGLSELDDLKMNEM